MSVFDPKFKYRSSLNTDIAETFKKARKAIELAKERAKREAEDAQRQYDEKVKSIGCRK
jgi:CRISPR/Cas system-associated endonuclease Cas1